jgi:hypothetical protein
MAPRLSRSAIKQIGINILNRRDRTINNNRVDILFKSCYGCSVVVVAIIWNILVVENRVPNKGLPKHLFWCLALMKTYCTENVYSAMFDVDPGTFRKWSWKFILAVSRLKIVSTFKNPIIALYYSVLQF